MPLPIGLTIWGVDNPSPPAQDTQDFYSFDLTQGQTATAVVESLNGKSADITIVDANGDVLASGVSGPTNVSQAIEDFVAPSTGTYYVEITGDAGLQYSVVVTRGADFTLQPHNSISTAQNLTGTGGALGYLAPPSAPLFLLDDNLYNPPFPIWQVDPNTGAFIGSSIPSPDDGGAGPYGLNMAYDGTDLYYNAGEFEGDNTIYKVDPTTGAVISSFQPPSSVPPLTGIAWFEGHLYGVAAYNSSFTTVINEIFEFDASGNVINSFSTGVTNEIMEGLAGDPDHGVLWAVSQTTTGAIGGSLYELDPTTGAVLESAPDASTGFEQDLGYFNNELYVSDAVDFGFGNTIDVYSTATLTLDRRLPVATQGFASGLAADGLGGAAKDDWYSVNVEAGQSLFIQSSTPSDQGGQFPNTASLEISVYDTFGNLVAQGVKMADGRNESLFFNAPISGNYKIDITEDPGGAGEYFLQVNTATFPSGGVSGQVYNDLNGDGTLEPGEPGLQGWEVDLFDSNNNFVASQLTDANGDFDFEGLDPGTYTVEEFVQAGWTQTAPAPPGTFTMTVTAGATVSGLEFGNFQDITVSGEVFNDLNGNGSLDPGDPGLPGWTVDLFDSAGDLIATTTTDVNGDYSFSDLGPGTYTVVEEILPGWVQTFPAPPGTYTVTASSGLNETGLNFGDFEQVTYSGTVYDDLNGNGVDDPGEPGLQGWTVELLSNGSVVETTTSASDGSYSFADVAPGAYTIEEIMQTGWFQTEPQNPFFYSVTATSGSSQSGLNFGNFQLVNITGEVYNDLNGNGNLDPGEPGLQGWTVNLLNQAGNTVATTTSDANGDYEFDDLFPGTFIVEEVLQSGWVQTQPVNPNFYTFATQSGLNETGLNFGNAGTGTFTGTVYNDLNGDGTQESNEPPLANWTIDLLDSNSNIVATTTSNAMGQYTFADLGPVVYTIEEIVQPGWVITQPTNPPGTYTLAAQGGTKISGLDFGNFTEVTVSGSIYNDQDGNGLRGSSEPGLAGWTVDLEDSSGNVLASTLTDSNGNYSFTDVGAGSYQVAEVVPTGWVQTQPQFPINYSFTTHSGGNLTALVFGDHASPALTPVAVIDNGQPGYSETGSWSTVLGGFNGTNRIARTSRSSPPTATAEWSFTGLAPASYQVFVTFAGKPNYAKTAPFTVLDGGTTLGLVNLNESILVTQSQGGLAQGSFGGVGWLELGVFTSSDGNLEVLLDNLTNQNFIDADGVLLVPNSGQALGHPVTPPPSAGSPALAMGAPGASGTTAVQIATGKNGQTTTNTVSLGTVTPPVALNVVYQGAPPAQGTTSATSVVDLAISSLADDAVTSKKANA